VNETAERVTYATLAGGESEDFPRRWSLALERLRPALGARHGRAIEDDDRGGEGAGETFEDRSPIDRRVLLGSFPVGIEVGKSRMEAMGDVTETADLIRYYCEQMDSGGPYYLQQFMREQSRTVVR
jgi:hypothetical protein